jgi:hypothetical protein
MKVVVASILGAVVVLLAFAALAFYGSGVSLALRHTFEPANVAVDNEVFHESQQYNDGMVRDLENLKMQYDEGTPNQKLMLRSTILHRFAGYPVNRLTPELRAFYTDLRRAP